MDKQDVSRQRASRQPQAGRAVRFPPAVEALEDGQALTAQAIVFTIDPATSKVSMSGTLTTPAGSWNLVEQGVGSLTTSFSGTIGTVVDFAASSIVFREAGTRLDAAVSGSWSPRPGGLAGTAPADYGGKFDAIVVTVFVAIRDMAATLATGARLGQTGSTWTFGFGQQLKFTAGTVDYFSEGPLASSIGSGSVPLPNRAAVNAAGAGQIEDLGSGNYRLTVPVQVSIASDVGSGSTLTLGAQGMLVATASVPPVPMSTS